MIENALRELQQTPIAALSGLGSLIALAIGFLLSLRGLRLQQGNQGANEVEADNPQSSVLQAVDFRITLACLFLMPAIASGFALASSLAFGLGAIAGIVAAIMLLAASVSVTAILSGTILRPWLNSIYHERTINKQRVGYMGPMEYVKFNEVVGFVIALTSFAVFALFLLEGAFQAFYSMMNSVPASADAVRGETEADRIFYSVIITGLAVGLPNLVLYPVLSLWAGFLFRSHSGTY